MALQFFIYTPPGKRALKIRYTDAEIVVIDVVRALGYKESSARNQYRNFERDIPGFRHWVRDGLRWMPIDPCLIHVMANTRMRASARQLLPVLRTKGVLRGAGANDIVVVPRLQSNYIEALEQAFGHDCDLEIEKVAGPNRQYRVDMYIGAPHCFGVEIDEHGHRGYNKAEDAIRTALIPFPLLRIDTDKVPVGLCVRMVCEFMLKAKKTPDPAPAPTPGPSAQP